MTAAPRVAVSIVAYRTEPSVLARALGALRASDHPPEWIFLHVNGATAADAPPAAMPTLEVTSTERNLGFAGAHNALLERAFAAGADLVVVHNPDLTLAPEALGRLSRAVESASGRLYGPLLERADAGGAATGLTDSAGIVWSADARHRDSAHGEPLGRPRTEPHRVAGISGACLVVPRRVYERIVAASGEFFDDDFIAYREDAELAIRAELLGVESWLVPAARGLHVRTQRGTTRGGDPVVDLLGVRNRFLILAKWGRLRPGRLPLALLRDLVVVGGVLTRERSSLPGLRQAWRLRGRMRAKRAAVLAWLQAHPDPWP